MSSTTVSVKRHNHRVHPCSRKRKDELLGILIAKNSEQSILVITAHDPEPIKKIIADENIAVMSDADLADTPVQQYDLLISYDLPDSAIAYMVRLARAKTYALILLDPNEQKQLYPIETLLGRNLLEEVISGFEIISDKPEKREGKPFNDRKPKRDFKPRQDVQRGDRKRDDRPRRDDKHPERKPYASDVKDKNKSDKWAKKDGAPSKYIGKDENGKPIFSGKTRERNHRYDGTPKENADNASSKRYDSKPKFSEGDKKPGDNRSRSYDAKQKSDTQGKKPWDKSRSYNDKKQSRPYDKTSKSKSYSSKSTDTKPAPKRPPRTFKKSLEQQKKSD